MYGSHLRWVYLSDGGGVSPALAENEAWLLVSFGSVVHFGSQAA